jgi:hypothetical protein
MKEYIHLSNLLFNPLLTPSEIIQRGAFGGTYFGIPIEEYTDFDYESIFKMFKGIDTEMYLGEKYNRKLNRFGVKAGMPYEYWKEMGWMHEDDPYGWFEWYCKFYSGRRHQDDKRQIIRWQNFTGIKGRWRKRIYSRIYETKDWNISPIIQQSLMHWGYEVNVPDYDLWIEENKRE